MNLNKYPNIKETNPIDFAETDKGYEFHYNVTDSYAKTLNVNSLGVHNGWVVEGEIHEDYFSWVNDFTAKKEEWFVKGDFEDTVTCSSLDAFEDFLSNVTVEDWDYDDI